MAIMISLLTGTLVLKQPGQCVVEASGVGYGASISLATFSALPEAGNKCQLHVHTYVREDQITLYGFTTPDEKAIFLRLIAISGVGPKTALAILSGIPAGDLVEAIVAEDRLRLSTIPGVGKKTADRIIVELKDRITRGMPLAQGAPGRGRLHEDAVSALTNLGYHRAAAEGALKKAGFKDDWPLEEAIRAALKELCRG